MNRHVRRWPAEAAYVALVGGLGVTGAVRESSPWYLAAVALTLPCGLAALVVMYGGYALLSGVGGLWASTTRPGGDEAAWLSTGSAVVNVLALVLAALAEVVLLEQWIRRRGGGGRRPASVTAWHGRGWSRH